jgi:uncharacterized protein
MTRLQKLMQILVSVDDTPHQTALAFGVGVFIAFSPLLGFHWVLALVACFALRINKVVTFLGTYINNPWTIAPLYLAGTAVGCALLGVSTEGLKTIEWHSEGAAFYRGLLQHLRPYLWPYVVGNTLLGIVTGFGSYFLLRWFLERRKHAAPAETQPPT